ncbi:MAG: disulfide bond formation protein B [Burkholderiaceae bacterium]|jgi:disulfide bond formation protein DsbB|nr:disulfide bond formation protein B [Burkholderiaceae bacterium]
MNLPSPRVLWTLAAIACGATVALSLGLTAALGLHPCHLCIFQRLLFMILTVLFGVTAWYWPRRAGVLAVLLSLPVSASGVVAAAYQSWLQAQPTGSISCTAGDPGLIEQLVEWLGQRLPDLFLATGFCENAELSILGLSLANWALVAQTCALVVAAWALWARRRAI